MSGASHPSIDTLLIHAGEPQPRIRGAVAMPIFQSSTFEFGGDVGYHDIRYIRLNNTPNHEALHAKLAALERTETSLVTSSGMAAISAALLTLLSPGDHFLAHRALYGGTHDLVTGELKRFGIEHSFVDTANPATWEAARRPNTKLFYCETLTNPLMEVGDLPAVSAFAKRHGLVSMIDNTFASPFNFRPAEHGFDLMLHSGTKYLNGHNDIVCGVVAGTRTHVDAIRKTLNHYGGSLDPHACFLLHRGLKTLAVRMRHQNESALTVARWLSQHPAVETVNHPFLPQHPHHARAKQLLAGCGGMLSVELRGGLPAARSFVERVQLAVHAPSLGGPETLVILPALSSHAGMQADERRRAGIADGLVRISIGLEDSNDVIADFKQALD